MITIKSNLVLLTRTFRLAIGLFFLIYNVVVLFPEFVQPVAEVFSKVYGIFREYTSTSESRSPETSSKVQSDLDSLIKDSKVNVEATSESKKVESESSYENSNDSLAVANTEISQKVDTQPQNGTMAPNDLSEAQMQRFMAIDNFVASMNPTERAANQAVVFEIYKDFAASVSPQHLADFNTFFGNNELSTKGAAFSIQKEALLKAIDEFQAKSPVIGPSVDASDPEALKSSMSNEMLSSLYDKYTDPDGPLRSRYANEEEARKAATAHYIKSHPESEQAGLAAALNEPEQDTAVNNVEATTSVHKGTPQDKFAKVIEELKVRNKVPGNKKN